ncbi:MAG TPA: nuclear transport factor 2 family protein [Stellaceae bacterium]|nr:nuclear transport factor 2 family protein [Stellaceae bacterium]
MTVRDPEVQALIDKQAITETLMRYSRGLDRHDRAVLESIYWPDAVDDHITYRGDAKGFIDHAFEFTKDVRTSHMLLNILIELVSDTRAVSETYYIGYHDLPGAIGREDFSMGGRYLDIHEKRGNEWRIIKRVLTCDWYTRAPGTARWGEGLLAPLKTRGEQGPDDPLYRMLAEARGEG